MPGPDGWIRRIVTSFLDRLLDGAHRRVEEARQREPLPALRERASATPPPPDLVVALAGPGVAVVAEVKRASPSKGELARGLDAEAQGRAYRRGGAHAISVLTEPEQFLGSLTDLVVVSALGTPTLRKDFVVDPYQVWEARAAGAAAVLLVVAALGPDDLRALQAEADAAGLTALVEVHDVDELAVARTVEPRVVGVNARDLRSFEVDRDAFARLRPGIPAGTLAVAESGVRGPDDVRAAAGQGADAVLVGESLVTAEDPAATVAALVAAGAVALPRSR
jgi:indole-3-glycerol phosphate synthase